MSITPTLGRPSAPTAARTARQRVSWRHPVLFSVLLMVAAAGVMSLVNRIDDSWDRQALRAVEAAAEKADQPVGVINEELANNWSTATGPREEVLKTYLGPGNRYLEPIHYDKCDNPLMEESGDRCYFFAVQPGKSFEADKVTGMVKICYLDPYRTPNAMGYVSVLD